MKSRVSIEEWERISRIHTRTVSGVIKNVSVDIRINSIANIGNDYIVGKQIGVGTYGSVYKVKESSTGIHRAMKIMSKDRVNFETMYNEYSIVKTLVLFYIGSPKYSKNPRYKTRRPELLLGERILFWVYSIGKVNLV